MRRIQIYYLPGATLGAVAGAWLLLESRLPERAALVRNGRYGIQIGWFDTSAFLGTAMLVLALAWVAQAVTDRPRKPSWVSHTCFYVALGTLYATGIFLAGSVGRNEPETGVGLLAFAGLIPAGWAGTVMAARIEDARARQEGAWDDQGARPSVGLGPSEKALWTGSQKMRGHDAALWGAPLVVVFTIVLSLTDGFYAYELLPIGFVVVMLAYGLVTMSVQIGVFEREVRVSGGPLRVPLRRIPLAEVVAASVEHVRPRDYGGWGYHAKAGRAALVVRGGDGLVLRRRKGRDVVVTVDDARAGAGLVNDLL